MNLNSFSFIVFFAAIVAVMAILQIIRKKFTNVGKLQLIFLLLFSYFFILKSDWRFCVCIIIITLLTYFSGMWINSTHSAKILVGGGGASNPIPRLLQVHKLFYKQLQIHD